MLIILGNKKKIYLRDKMNEEFKKENYADVQRMVDEYKFRCPFIDCKYQSKTLLAIMIHLDIRHNVMYDKHSE